MTSAAGRSGRFRSSRTTSGRTAAAIRSACAPLPAVPATVNPASSRYRAVPSRQIGWSSTTSTRAGAAGDTASGSTSGPGHTQLDLRSLSRG